jgi:hypothetical protein
MQKAGMDYGSLHHVWVLEVTLLKNSQAGFVMAALCTDGTGDDSDGEDEFAAGQHYCCFAFVESCFWMFCCFLLRLG